MKKVTNDDLRFALASVCDSQEEAEARFEKKIFGGLVMQIAETHSRRETTKSPMDFVGAVCGLVFLGGVLSLALLPLLPSFWATAEAASSPVRWMVEIPAFILSCFGMEIYLTEKYIRKHGHPPPDYLA